MCFPLTTCPPIEILDKPCKPFIFSVIKYLCILQKVVLRFYRDGGYENSLEMQISGNNNYLTTGARNLAIML